MSAMNNTETPGTATVKSKHTANRSNIKYCGWDANELKEFSEIAKLIKSQRSQQYRQLIKEHYKNNVENKDNRKYGIITPTPSKSTDSSIHPSSIRDRLYYIVLFCVFIDQVILPIEALSNPTFRLTLHFFATLQILLPRFDVGTIYQPTTTRIIISKETTISSCRLNESRG